MEIQVYEEPKCLAIGSMLHKETNEMRNRLMNCENKKMAKGIEVLGKIRAD